MLRSACTEAQSPAEHDALMRRGTPALAGASISEKQKSFDNDLERMQRERGELMGQQSGPGGPRRPMGQGPGMMR